VWTLKPAFSYLTPNGGLSPTLKSRGDFIRTTAGNCPDPALIAGFLLPNVFAVR
jgi:hypothetical protein